MTNFVKKVLLSFDLRSLSDSKINVVWVILFVRHVANIHGISFCTHVGKSTRCLTTEMTNFYGGCVSESIPFIHCDYVQIC